MFIKISKIYQASQKLLALFALTTVSPYAFSQPETVEKRKGKISGYFDLNGKHGNKRGLFKSSVFLPLVQSDPVLDTKDYLIFFDGRAVRDTQRNFEFNLGLGLRYYLQDKDLILGGVAFFDRRHSQFSNKFNQLTLNLHMLSPNWQVDGNIYLPKAHHGISSRLLQPTGEIRWYNNGRRRAQVMNSKVTREAALRGADVRFMYTLPFLPKLNVGLTAYTFQAKDFPTVRGLGFQAEYRFNNYVYFEAELKYDNARKLAGYYGLQIRIPLSGFGNASPGQSELNERYMRKVYRDVDVVTQNGQETWHAAEDKLYSKDEISVAFRGTNEVEGSGTNYDPYNLSRKRIDEIMVEAQNTDCEDHLLASKKDHELLKVLLEDDKGVYREDMKENAANPHGRRTVVKFAAIRNYYKSLVDNIKSQIPVLPEGEQVMQHVNTQFERKFREVRAAVGREDYEKLCLDLHQFALSQALNEHLEERALNNEQPAPAAQDFVPMMQQRDINEPGQPQNNPVFGARAFEAPVLAEVNNEARQKYKELLRQIKLLQDLQLEVLPEQEAIVYQDEEIRIDQKCEKARQHLNSMLSNQELFNHISYRVGVEQTEGKTNQEILATYAQLMGELEKYKKELIGKATNIEIPRMKTLDRHEADALFLPEMIDHFKNAIEIQNNASEEQLQLIRALEGEDIDNRKLIYKEGKIQYAERLSKYVDERANLLEALDDFANNKYNVLLELVYQRYGDMSTDEKKEQILKEWDMLIEIIPQVPTREELARKTDEEKSTLANKLKDQYNAALRIRLTQEWIRDLDNRPLPIQQGETLEKYENRLNDQYHKTLLKRIPSIYEVDATHMKPFEGAKSLEKRVQAQLKYLYESDRTDTANNNHRRYKRLLEYLETAYNTPRNNNDRANNGHVSLADLAALSGGVPANIQEAARVLTQIIRQFDINAVDSTANKKVIIRLEGNGDQAQYKLLEEYGNAYHERTDAAASASWAVKGQYYLQRILDYIQDNPDNYSARLQLLQVLYDVSYSGVCYNGCLYAISCLYDQFYDKKDPVCGGVPVTFRDNIADTLWRSREKIFKDVIGFRYDNQQTHSDNYFRSKLSSTLGINPEDDPNDPYMIIHSSKVPLPQEVQEMFFNGKKGEPYFKELMRIREVAPALNNYSNEKARECSGYNAGEIVWQVQNLVHQVPDFFKETRDALETEEHLRSLEAEEVFEWAHRKSEDDLLDIGIDKENVIANYEALKTEVQGGVGDNAYDNTNLYKAYMLETFIKILNPGQINQGQVNQGQVNQGQVNQAKAYIHPAGIARYLNMQEGFLKTRNN